jgi:hypothetical protein
MLTTDPNYGLSVRRPDHPGIPRVRKATSSTGAPHRLTETAAAGVPAIFVQASAGHAHGSTTERYLHGAKPPTPPRPSLVRALCSLWLAEKNWRLHTVLEPNILRLTAEHSGAGRPMGRNHAIPGVLRLPRIGSVG